MIRIFWAGEECIEVEIPDHICEDNLRHRLEHYVETHGLDCGPYECWTEE